MNAYILASSLDSTLDLLSKGSYRVLSGGTDFYPRQGNEPFKDSILDISGVEELRAIVEQEDSWRIGALATWTDVVTAKLPPEFNALQLAALEVGALQIQNVGTVAGNICNASPAADGVPPLLTLNAQVEVRSTIGMRQVPLGEFIQGNRKTLCGPKELVTAVLIPKDIFGRARSHFIKLGSRRYMVISIAMVAAVLEATSDNHIASARIAVGSCSLVAQRLSVLESELVGHEISPALGALVQADHLTPLAPIDDLRAKAAYRLIAAEEMVRRTLSICGARD